MGDSSPLLNEGGRILHFLKAHRLSLESRVSTKRTKPKTNVEVNNGNNKTQKLGRKAKFKALLLDPSFPPEAPTILENLTNLHCRYPLGEKLEPAKFFCGRKPVAKFQYCELHLMISYQKKGENEEDVITEEDIPVYGKKIKSA